MVVITGGMSLSTPVATNIKRLSYRWAPDTYEAQTVMGQINPVSFKFPHKWVIGEVGMLSENKSTMDTYVKSTLNNSTLNMVASQRDVSGSLWTYTFTGCVFLNEQLTVNDNEDVLTIYPFIARYMSSTITA